MPLSFNQLCGEQRDCLLDALYSQGVEDELLESTLDDYASRLYDDEICHLQKNLSERTYVYRGMAISHAELDSLKYSTNLGVHWTTEKSVASQWNPATSDHPNSGLVRVLIEGEILITDICLASTAINRLVSPHEKELTLKDGSLPSRIRVSILL